MNDSCGRELILCAFTDSHVMGVDPKHQGRGAGLAVLKHAFWMGEQTGLPMYFEASPTVVKMYERFGCERLEEKVVHSAETLGLDDDIEVPLMVKMPSVANGMTFAEWRAKGFPDFAAPAKPNGTH